VNRASWPARAGWVESVDGRCWPVLIYQILALSLENGAVSAEATWQQLSRAPDFRKISREEYDRLNSWMLSDGGPKAEKRFGRKNFTELFAVCSSPQNYTAQIVGGQRHGTLQEAFVDRLVDEVSTFLLGGRGWGVVRVQHCRAPGRRRTGPPGPPGHLGRVPSAAPGVRGLPADPGDPAQPRPNSLPG
jgi:ATP-dependent Lhr-like helicase